MQFHAGMQIGPFPPTVSSESQSSAEEVSDISSEVLEQLLCSLHGVHQETCSIYECLISSAAQSPLHPSYFLLSWICWSSGNDSCKYHVLFCILERKLSTTTTEKTNQANKWLRTKKRLKIWTKCSIVSWRFTLSAFEGWKYLNRNCFQSHSDQIGTSISQKHVIDFSPWKLNSGPDAWPLSRVFGIS